MGESKAKEAKPRAFTPRVLDLGGRLVRLEADGKVYGVHMSRGARLHDPALVQHVHEIGGQLDAQMAKAIEAAKAKGAEEAAAQPEPETVAAVPADA